jgi:hypothetical protein
MGSSAAGMTKVGCGAECARTAPGLASGPVGLPSPLAVSMGMPMTRFRNAKWTEKSTEPQNPKLKPFGPNEGHCQLFIFA